MTDQGDNLFAWAEQQACKPIAPPAQIPRTLPAEELPADVIRIADLLRDRRGTANALTAPRIAELLNIRPDATPTARGTHVRALLSRHFRDLPFTLCASPASGYFRPATSDELSHYRRDLHSRAREILTRLRDLKAQARSEGIL